MSKILRNIKIMYWDCRYCSTQGIPGGDIKGNPTLSCSNCGATRDKDVEFYHTSESHKNILNSNLINNIVNNPDWTCDHCGAGNNRNDSSCSQCGDSRTKEDVKNKIKHGKIETKNPVSRYPDEPKINHLGGYGNAPSVNESGGFDLPTAEPIIEQSLPQEPPRPPINKSRLLLILGASFSAILISFIIWGLIPRDIEVEVIGHEWQRNIKVEKNVECHESSWSGYPSGAYNQRKKWEDTGNDRKISDGYHTERKVTGQEDCNCRTRTRAVNCHDVDNGNGYSHEECDKESYQECDRCDVYGDVRVEDFHYEDIYDWHYYYNIMRWKFDHNVTTGAKDKKPFWGHDILVENDKLYRYGNKNEKYVIFINEKNGNDHKSSVEEARWMKINRGDKIIGRKSSFGVWYGIK